MFFRAGASAWSRGSGGLHSLRRAVRSSAVPLRAEPFRMAVRGRCLGGDVRGAGEGYARSAVGVGRCAGGVTDRQPVGSRARVEGERRARSERAACGGAGALRAAVYEDEPEVIPRERRGRAGSPPAQGRARPGADPARQPGLPVGGSVHLVRPAGPNCAASTKVSLAGARPSPGAMGGPPAGGGGAATPPPTSNAPPRSASSPDASSTSHRQPQTPTTSRSNPA